MTATASPEPAAASIRWHFLPAPGTWKYHLMLGAVGILVLGPLGGLTAAFMNFSIGFYIGGQVLAGILGSTVTYGYGPDGKHGANFMQTCAASVAGLSGMAIIVQAMVWLGLREPPAWHIILYLCCIGMFGAGVGMLFTPILVDRLRLPYPSGLAVANILRALTDKRLLKRSVATLGGGTAAGLVGGMASLKIAAMEAVGLSTSTIGAGMIVGARIGIPAVVGGVASWALKPYFIEIAWLEPTSPVRKITFIIALGMIMGAAIIDITLILASAIRRVQAVNDEEGRVAEEPWKRTNTRRLVVWCAVWGAGVVACGAFLFGASVPFLLAAVALVFVFVLVNGISQGITDSNPISSAFVVTVLLLGAFGLANATLGLVSAAIVLVAVTVAIDMQQDRSTGWRLGSDRTTQFRYQVAGVAMGAVMAVVFAKVFMAAYPALAADQTAGVHVDGWQSAMTFKMVGALKNLTNPRPYTYPALWIGVGIGLFTELLRKIIKSRVAYRAFIARSKTGFTLDFLLDAVVLPSPYASSFGGFVEIATSIWFGGGGILGSLLGVIGKSGGPSAPEKDLAGEALPEDMNTVSLIGGGLIAGDSLAALGFGIAILVSKLGGE